MKIFYSKLCGSIFMLKRHQKADMGTLLFIKIPNTDKAIDLDSAKEIDFDHIDDITKMKYKKIIGKLR